VAIYLNLEARATSISSLITVFIVRVENHKQAGKDIIHRENAHPNKKAIILIRVNEMYY